MYSRTRKLKALTAQADDDSLGQRKQDTYSLSTSSHRGKENHVQFATFQDVFQSAVQLKQKNKLPTAPKLSPISQLVDDNLFDVKVPVNKISLDDRQTELFSDLIQCFNKETNDQSKKPMLQEGEKDKMGTEPSAELTESPSAESIDFQADPAEEPYVTLFEDMPEESSEESLHGVRPYITVPPDYDFNNLIEYDNDNYWD